MWNIKNVVSTVSFPLHVWVVFSVLCAECIVLSGYILTNCFGCSEEVM